MKPTIVFATMCKNESDCIVKTLESVYKYIDYYIVCDTGSTDNTVELVENFFKDKNIPGEIYSDKWVNFGYNKTLMMSRAKNKADFIFHIDADDVLVGEINFDDTVYYYDVLNVTFKRGNLAWKTTAFYNASYDWRFCGVAHTIIKCVQKPEVSIYDLPETFYIAGEPVGSRSLNPQKYAHDAQILTEQFFSTLIDDPDGLNSRSVFYAAQSYMDSKLFTKAIQWYSLYTKLKHQWEEEVFESYIRLAQCHMELNSNEEAILKYIKLAIDLYEDRAEPYALLGRYYLYQAKDAEKAYQYLMIALKKNYSAVCSKYLLFVNRNCYGKYLYDDISVSCYYTNRHYEGLYFLNEIMQDQEFSDHATRLMENKNHFLKAIQI